ncbi:MAG: response regulator [Congregibacter sp.]
MERHLATILVVEDDDVDFKLLVRMFAKQKIANVIVRAKDGLDALEKIENGEVKKPFFILLDLNMPRMNGQEFLTEIRSRPELSDTVVFLLTTSEDHEDVRQGFSQHAAGYFLKDNIDGSLERVVEVLGGYWQIVILPENTMP